MINKGKKVMIHAYKKNGWLYRTWEFPVVIEENEYYICVFIKNARITTSKKLSTRNFHSKNEKNSFWFFFKDEWFNIIATIHSNKLISYYINLASPFLYEEEAIKYIDFDLDVKICQNGQIVVLDQKEFDVNRLEFNYGKKLTKVIELESEKFRDKNNLIKLIKYINKNIVRYLSSSKSSDNVNECIENECKLKENS